MLEEGLYSQCFYKAVISISNLHRPIQSFHRYKNFLQSVCLANENCTLFILSVLCALRAPWNMNSMAVSPSVQLDNCILREVSFFALSGNLIVSDLAGAERLTKLL